MSFLPLSHNFSGPIPGEFAPETIIDTLYDYVDFLSKNSTIAKEPRSITLDVLIVGGGAAGLVSAYELSRIRNLNNNQALNITLVDAASHLGGRMNSQIFTDPGYSNKIFELGCMRFPPSSKTLFYYLDKFGIEWEDNFPDPGVVNGELYYENNVIKWNKGDDAPDSPLFQRLGRDLAAMIEHVLGSKRKINAKSPSKLFDYWYIYQKDPSRENKKFLSDAWQKIIDEYKDVSFYDGIFRLANDPKLVEIPWTTSDMNAFGALGVGAGGLSPMFPVSFLEILRLYANGWEDYQRLVPGGIKQLVNAFETQLIENMVEIRLNEPLVFGLQSGLTPENLPPNTLYWLKKKDDSTPYYYVKFTDGKIKRFNAIIVATTTRAMEMMNLTVSRQSPPTALPNKNIQYLSTSQQAAAGIRSLNLVSSSKLFVLTKSKFWYRENNKFGKDLPQNIQTDSLFRGLYCLNYDGESIKDGMGVVLISYVWAGDSDRILALDPADRYQKFLAVLWQINPDFAMALEANRITGIDPEQPWERGVNFLDWQSTPYQNGAFKLQYPGEDINCYDTFFQYQSCNPTPDFPQNIFIAGDSVSWAGGWMEGALTSGINAACAVSRALEQKIPLMSPLAIDPYLYIYDNPPAAKDK